jgi:hypothetical protein
MPATPHSFLSLGVTSCASPTFVGYPRISCLAAFDRLVYALFLAERRMKLMRAFNLHRKSGPLGFPASQPSTELCMRVSVKKGA